MNIYFLSCKPKCKEDLVLARHNIIYNINEWNSMIYEAQTKLFCFNKWDGISLPFEKLVVESYHPIYRIGLNI